MRTRVFVKKVQVKEEDTRSKSESESVESDVDSPRRNLLYELEANERFYSKAKHEVAGNHLPET